MDVLETIENQSLKESTSLVNLISESDAIGSRFVAHLDSVDQFKNDYKQRVQNAFGSELTS